jgi:undecaprenyl-diphosphatase
MKSRLTKTFWILLLALAAWKVLVAWRLDPCYDECYYFYWSLFPQPSYFDHPPLTAWAMTASGLVFGDSVWTIRIWPLLLGLLFTLVGRELAGRMFSPEAGDRAGILLLLMPAFAGNGIIMTPDVFFSLAWAFGVFLAWRAMQADRHRWMYWALAGAAGGVGALAKYNMILFYFSLGMVWLLSPGRRVEMLGGVMLAGIISLVVFSPVLVWNAQHDWISFKFQAGHGFAGKHGFWDTFPPYLGGLLLVSTPVLGVQVFHAATRGIRSDGWNGRFLSAFFWVVVVFFGLSACRTMVGPNWPMLAFFTGLILLAGQWHQYPRWVRQLSLVFLAGLAGMAVLFLTGVALAADRLADSTIPAAVPRLVEFVGGRKLGAAVVARQAETQAKMVCTGRHQMFARLAFFAPSLRPYLWIPIRGSLRFPWIDDRAWIGEDALLVVGSARDARILSAWFDQVGEIETGAEPALAPGGKAVHFYLGRHYRYQMPDEGQPTGERTGE